MDTKSVSPSEALFGFMGWLTCRNEPVTFSATNNAAIGADLVAEYCKSQGFAGPRASVYPANLKTMPPC